MRMMTIIMTTMMIILSNNLAMCCRCWNSSHTADHHHHRCSQHNSKAQAEEKLCRKNRGKSPKDWLPVWKSPWRHLADPWSHRLNHPAATANHSYQKSILQFVQVGTRILPFFLATFGRRKNKNLKNFEETKLWYLLMGLPRIEHWASQNPEHFCREIQKIHLF